MGSKNVIHDVQNVEMGIINPAFSLDSTLEECNNGENPTSLVHLSHESDKETVANLPVISLDEKENEEKSRETWDSQLEFLLSCVAMSVGLGNVWRFPFTAYENGGGAFLVPYMISLLLLGRPMYYLEMCLGQFTSYGPIKMWEIVPFFKGVGYAASLAVFTTTSFYCSIMAVSLYYLFASFSNPLPWSEEVCNAYNLTEHYTESSKNAMCEAHKANGNDSYAELYYLLTVFPQYAHINNGIGVPHWKLVICLMFAWLTIYLSLIKGIKTAGKAAYFNAGFPYVVLVIMLVRGLMLPGALDGIYYFVKPQWHKILDPKVWFAAVSQCFFSLSVGFGVIVFLSSHNKFRHNIFRDAIVISVTDTFTSCLAGCTIFAMLGYLAKTLNVDISVVSRGGPGLAFVAFPASISRLKQFPQGFSILFFLMLYTLGVGSAVALTGQLITIIRDEFPSWKKWKVGLFVCTVGFMSGLVYVTPGGQFILTLVNHNGADFIIYITAMIEIIAISWVYGVNKFCDDIKFMLGRETELYWKICWAFVMPVGLCSLLVYYFVQYTALTHEGVDFPSSAIVSGWVLTSVILSALPICAIQAVRNSPGDTWFQKLKASLKPASTWGPKQPSERSAWLKMKQEQQLKKSGKSTPASSDPGAPSEASTITAL